MLDSGSEINAVSPLFIDKYAGDDIKKAGTIRVKGVNAVMTRQKYSNVPVTIFGVDVIMDNLTEVGLGGHAILLGAPFFKNFIVQIDYPNTRLRVLPKKSVDLKKLKNVNIRRDKSSSLPAIEVTINDKDVWLILDTGSNSGLLVKRNYAKSQNWLTAETNTLEGMSRGVNASSEIELFNIPSLKIGPYDLENILVTVPGEGEKITVGNRYRGIYRSTMSKQTHGLLGYEILKHFILTIDYSNYRAHIFAP